MNAYRSRTSLKLKRRGQGRRRQSSSSVGSGELDAESVRRHRPDYIVVLLISILLAVGAVTVYAISPGITQAQGLPENFFSQKQLLAIGLGIVAFIVASAVRLKTWRQLEVSMLVLAVTAGVAVRFFGDRINGAYRWFNFGGISFQVAEFMKLALIIWLAGFLARRMAQKRMGDPDTFKKLGIAVVSVVIIVAGLQSDLGSAAVMMAIIGAMAFVAGLPMRNIMLVAAGVCILTVGAIASSEYRRDRVSTFLNPTADCQDEGYQACQALITVGSGGLAGKGLGRSVQAYGYLPEAANDSIFAIVSEKFGFIGSSMIIGVFFVLFRRLYEIAKRASSNYSQLLVSGVLIWLSIQMMINVGAMLGLLPLKGITLPLVSHGGTSIIFILVALGIAFHASRYTELGRVVTKQYDSGESLVPISSVKRPMYSRSSRNSRHYGTRST